MGERVPFSLQAWPTVDKEKESLQYLISRINEQKGSFRNVTEESLEQELRHAEHGKTDAEEEDAGEEGEEEIEDPKTKKEEVYEVREEILRQISYVS